MLGISESTKKIRELKTTLCHQDLIEKNIVNYQHRDRFWLLQFDYDRLLGQWSKAKSTLSRLCECAVKSDVPRINNSMAVHLRKGSHALYFYLILIQFFCDNNLGHSACNFHEKVEATQILVRYNNNNIIKN